MARCPSCTQSRSEGIGLCVAVKMKQHPFDRVGKPADTLRTHPLVVNTTVSLIAHHHRKGTPELDRLNSRRVFALPVAQCSVLNPRRNKGSDQLFCQHVPEARGKDQPLDDVFVETNPAAVQTGAADAAECPDLAIKSRDHPALSISHTVGFEVRAPFHPPSLRLNKTN